MDFESILNELRSQRARIDQAIGALEGISRSGTSAKVGGMKRRHMSAAARARIGAAKKAWWAKHKRKPTGTKGRLQIVKRSPMGSATRKKLSTQIKARWAGRKKAA